MTSALNFCNTCEAHNNNARPSVSANNLQELIALAKSKPESLTFGSSGYAMAS